MPPVAIIAVVSVLLAGPAAASGPGVITGQLMYPSDYIPEDLTVCAESLRDGTTLCTAEQLQDELRRTIYRLELPPGDYHVYAKLTDQASFSDAYGPDYRAYYSEFVTCGLLASCTSHAPIVVRVGAGATVDSIDPTDWYRFD